MLAYALLMIVGLPLAAADVPLAPPMDLAATAVPEGVQLTWSPPVDASEDVTYAVYRDGTLLDAAVEGLSYVDTVSTATSSSTSTSATFYAVTAITPSGESLPAMHVFLVDCINHYPGQVPPVGVDPFSCAGVP